MKMAKNTRCVRERDIGGACKVMETTKKEKGFLLYQRWKRQFERLTMEQRGLLITAIFECDETGETPDCEDPAVGMALDFIAEQLAHDRQKYADKCEKNRRNAAKSHTGKGKGDASEEGLQARGGDRLQTVANACEVKRTVPYQIQIQNQNQIQIQIQTLFERETRTRARDAANTKTCGWRMQNTTNCSGRYTTLMGR